MNTNRKRKAEDILTFRVTKEEKNRIEKMIKLSCLKPSVYLRTVALGNQIVPTEIINPNVDKRLEQENKIIKLERKLKNQRKYTEIIFKEVASLDLNQVTVSDIQNLIMLIGRCPVEYRTLADKVIKELSKNFTINGD